MDPEAEETVTILKSEYDQLKEDQAMWYALEAAGVDNWQGWDDAMEILDLDEN